jgi:DNA (cytosine-5)-methyltransferase 1
MKKPTMLSLFDGSGAFPLAGAMNGIVPAYASEIELYPIAVSHLHFPDMKHLGSVTDVRGGDLGEIDVITFGSPC